MHLMKGFMVAVDDAGRFRPSAQPLPLLHPHEQTFGEMLDGWRAQQVSRGLSVGTIEVRVAVVQRLMLAAGEYPWRWSVEMVDEFFAERRTIHRNARSTIRSYQNSS